MATASPGGRHFFNPRDFGARGDGQAKDTCAVQKAIDACGAAGGGMVCVPPGRYLIAPIYLASRVNLHLEAGAVLLGSQEKRDYKLVTRRYAGTTQLTVEALINGDDLEHAAITGRGTVDGQGEVFWAPVRNYYQLPKAQRPTWTHLQPGTEAYVYETPWARPRLVEPQRCKDLLIEDVTLRNSGFWNLNMMFCENVKVHRVTLLNPAGLSPNGDGMDINSCRNVRVSDCFIDVNDDCICLKSGWNEDGPRYGVPTENVTVTNCITRGGHGGVVIGSDMSGGVRNVTASNCIFQGTEIGIRLKTMRGRGGVVENIQFSNLVMDGVAEAIVMDAHYWKPMPPEPVSERTPRLRGIRISHVEATGCKTAGFLHGLEELPISDVMLDAVRIQAEKPFWMRHVRALDLRHVRLDFSAGPELTISDASDVIIERLSAGGVHAASPVLRLERVRNAQVSGVTGASAGENVVQEETG